MSELLHRMVVFLAILLAVIFNLSLHNDRVIKTENNPIFPPFMDSTSTWVDSIMESLSLDEKIAQMLMVAAYSDKGQQHQEAITDLIVKEGIGGLVFFQGGPVKQALLTNHYQSVSKVPLLIAMDAEWGLGMRLDSVLSYPRQMMLGAIRNNELIYRMGCDIARQLKRLGVQMNFAPVVDVNNNPLNPVINSRSFGENKYNVAEKGISYMLGMQDEGVLCTAKHFPGHGDTDTDSHYSLPLINQSIDRLDTLELYPFRRCIEKGLTGIMCAHLYIPVMDSTVGRASSLSPLVVTGLLREKLGFEGLIVTDALNMKAVSQYYEPGQTEVLAALAGNDLLLMPADVGKAIRAIKREVRKGNIPEEEISSHCRKILMAKKWAGLDNFQSIDTTGLAEDLNLPDYRLLQTLLVEEALTLLSNHNDLVPLRHLDTLKIASLAIGTDSLNNFQQYLSLYSRVDHFQLPEAKNYNNRDSILKLLDNYNLVIAGIHNTDMRVVRKYGIPDEVFQLVDVISRNKKLVLSVFGNPYSLGRLFHPENIDALIMAYEDNELTQRFAAQLIFGGIPSLGKLPVSAGDVFKEGTGVETDHFRLKYSIPEAENMDSKGLLKIDSIAQDAIRQKATPGCQVLVARNGTVIYSKAFGYHTYAKKNQVGLTDIYDIASVTKIVSTLPCLMMLTERGAFNVDGKLSDYLPYLDTCDKGELIIKDMLTHQSGLAPWIPFYYSTLETMDPDEPLISRNLSAKYPFRLGNHTHMNKNITYAGKIYSEKFSEEYPYKVAEGMFMNRNYVDTIYNLIINSAILPEKEYRYSDLSFYFFKQIIESLTDTALYTYVYHNFYDVLGMDHTCYNPLERFSKDMIIPTENDVYFRRQLLDGYVHDPGAAMLGGVAGHAGIFSNTNDLAKFMQMYLNKGEYADNHFFSKETFDLYNSCPFCEEGNRRGLGFDKPEMNYEEDGPTCHCVSPESFGHTGFTGTMAWADPETGIIYIFLSNRIYPDQDNLKMVEMNVRTNIQQVIYDALIDRKSDTTYMIKPVSPDK